MTDFATYYRQQFQTDLLNFVRQIPIDGNKHYNKDEFNIQYFFLTPFYNYLDIVPADRQANFIVSLFWTVLVDQVFYTFYNGYSLFRSKTLYPKFIGNCTAPSLMSSQCGHHQHPKQILLAVNDFADKGNAFDFDREVFKGNESKVKRNTINFEEVLNSSKAVMKKEVEDYFSNHQREINGEEFWEKCLAELETNATKKPW